MALGGFTQSYCIYSCSGSYDLSFYIAGIIIIFSGAILLLLPAVKRVKQRLNSDSACNDREVEERQPNSRKGNKDGCVSRANQQQQQQSSKTTTTISATAI